MWAYAVANTCVKAIITGMAIAMLGAMFGWPEGSVMGGSLMIASSLVWIVSAIALSVVGQKKAPTSGDEGPWS